MIVRKVLLAAALAGVTATAQAVDVSLEIDASQLNRNSLDWYADYNQGAFWGPTGTMEHLEPAVEAGYTLGLATDLGDNWTGTFRVGNRKFEESDTVSSPGYELVATRVHSDWNDIASEDWNYGEAEYELNHQTVDFELAYAVGFGNGKGRVSPLFGLRVMNVDQSYDVLYDDTAGANGTTVEQTVDTRAFGFFAGVDALWQVSDLVAVTARGELGNLQATTSREFVEVGDDGTDPFVNVEDEFNEAVLTSSARVGVVFNAFDNGSTSAKVGLGYQVNTVDGLTDFISFPDDVNDGAQSRERQSLGYSGLYLNVAASF